MNCHYSLTGLTGPAHRCPECGREFDPADPSSFDSQTLQNLREKRFIVGVCVLVWAITLLVYVLMAWGMFLPAFVLGAAVCVVATLVMFVGFQRYSAPPR